MMVDRVVGCIFEGKQRPELQAREESS